MLNASKERQKEVDDNVDRVRRKLIAAWMFSRGHRLADIGKHLGVTARRAGVLRDSGNRRILCVFADDSSDWHATRSRKPSKEQADFARMCNFDISLMHSIREIHIIGMSISELTIKPA